ncbi:MAG: hypothetical protein N4A44_00890 [Alphaproteobacteria bacterium]|nr:hypothetical protein [Alphaproteobacteria bacterium]
MRYQLLDYINDDTEGYTDAQLRDIGKAYKELSKYVSEVNIDRRAEVAEINKEREKTYERIGYIVWTVFIVLVIGLIISFINYYSDLSLIGR